MIERLAVLLHGSVIGWLERPDGAADPTFAYDPAYVADGTSALSARLPLRAARFDARRVAPYLQGLLPELDTRRRWADRLGIAPDDTFGMLAQRGWDCPGAVQFCRPDDLSELTERADEYVSTDEAQIAQRLRNLADEPASWSMPEEHWSLGGQQEKFALAARAGGWFEAHGAAATTHIVKPGIRVLRRQALVEHVTMRAAALLGVDTAATTYLRFEDQWAVVVERFDRLTDADGQVQRLHQEDFCQAVGRLPANKYEARGGPTLADMVGVVQKQSRDQEADKLALADFLIVNVVTGAPDGHAKNVSMLRLAGGAWIAPLYDLATGLVYDRGAVDRTVALSVGGERQASRIRRRQWERAAATLGLPVDRVLGRVVQLAGAYPDALTEALDELGDADGAADVGERALSGARAHCTRLVDQLA